MKTGSNSTDSIAAGIALMVVLVILLVGLTWGIASAFKFLDSPALGTSITVSGSIVVALITVLVAKNIENRQRIAQENRQKKIPVYEQHLGSIFSVIMGTKLKHKKLSDDRLVEEFIEFTEKLILWGGADVIRAWGEIRAGFNELTTRQQMRVLAAFLRALRKDVGIVDDLSDEDLLGLFINDVHEITD